jgi:hypothetical protein
LSNCFSATQIKPLSNMEPENLEKPFKVTIVGDAGVGKVERDKA